MAAPAEKSSQFLQELSDWGSAPSEFRLRRIQRECEQLIKRTQNREIAGRLHVVAAMVCHRLGMAEATQDHARMAYQIDPKGGAIMHGVALMGTGRLAEAIPCFVASADDGDEHRFFALANLSEAFYVAGFATDAHAAFDEAREFACKHTINSSRFVLALQAAEIDRHAEAIRLLAEALGKSPDTSATELDAEIPAAFRQTLQLPFMRALSQSLALEVALERDAPTFAEPIDVEPAFHGTRPMRARATDALATRHDE